MTTPRDPAATATRSVLRVVVRGLPLAEGDKFQVGDLHVLVVGSASQADWPKTKIVEGDLEGMAWVDPEVAFHAGKALDAHPNIAATRIHVSG